MPPGPRLPDFLCIGGMRCGSTTLWKLFRQHPDLYLPGVKELHFFDRIHESDAVDLKDYSGWFEPAPLDAICGEFTPSYLTRAGVADSIHRVIPHARLIVILRNPLDRAWSHYWFRVRQGQERRSFSAAVRSIPTDRNAQAWRHDYIGWSRYAEHLLPYFDLFGDSAVCVMFTEELIANPIAEIRRAAAFLGISPDGFGDPKIPPESNSMIVPRSKFLYWLVSQADKRMRRRKSTHEAHRLLQRATFRARKSLQCRIRKPIPGSIRAHYAEWFRESDEQLASMLGRELPWGA